MLFTTKLNAGRWLHRCGFAVLSASAWACGTDTPTSPSPSPAAPSPTAPAPRPATPSAPGASKLTLSRADVVFNARVGTALVDSAIVSVTAASGAALSELTAIPTFPSGSPDGWLTVDLDQTTLPAKLTLRARTLSLQPGEYTAMVKLRAPGAEAESLLVTTRVLTGAGMALNAAKICFTMTFGDTTSKKDDVRVTSVDGSVIDGLTAAIVYDQGQATGWLESSFDVTAAPARLWLRGKPGTLPAGVYSATVNVASAKAGNSPVPIRVTLTINPFEPTKTSRLNVHILWEGPQNGGLATILGNSGIFCQSKLDGTPPGPGCKAVLADGIGDIELSYDQDWGARFLRWTGACTAEGTSAPCTVHFVTPGTTQEVTAVYGTLPSRIFDIRLSGAGASGTVTFSAPVTATGSGRPLVCRLVNGVPDQACNGVVEAGVGTFTVTATPDAGSVFVGWMVGGLPGLREFPAVLCDATTPSCTFTFTTGGGSFDGIVTFEPAAFIVSPTTLGIVQPSNQGIAIGPDNVIGRLSPGSGVVTGPGIECRLDDGAVSGDCAEVIQPGTRVVLTRHPAPGTYCTTHPDTERPDDCVMAVTVEQAHVTVPVQFFTKLMSIRVHMVGTGTASVGGQGVSCFLTDGVQTENNPFEPGQTGQCFNGTYGFGRHAVQTGQQAAGTTFVGWSGDCTRDSAYPPTGAVCVVDFSDPGQEVNITATYARQP